MESGKGVKGTQGKERLKHNKEKKKQKKESEGGRNIGIGERKSREVKGEIDRGEANDEQTRRSSEGNESK